LLKLIEFAFEGLGLFNKHIKSLYTYA